MRAGVFATPRPVPSRAMPALGGAFVLGLALPVFVLAGWRLTGWALAVVLWLGGQGLGLLVARSRSATGNLAASGVLAFAMLFKSLGILVVLVATAVSDPRLAIAAALTYALAYTLELGLSLAMYFGAEPR